MSRLQIRRPSNRQCLLWLAVEEHVRAKSHQKNSSLKRKPSSSLSAPCHHADDMCNLPHSMVHLGTKAYKMFERKNAMMDHTNYLREPQRRAYEFLLKQVQESRKRVAAASTHRRQAGGRNL